VDDGPFVQAAAAWGSVGRGITDVSQVLTTVETERRKAQDEQELAKAHGEWQAMEASQEAFMQAHPDDPQSWDGNARQLVSSLGKSWAGNRKYSPYVQAQLKNRIASQGPGFTGYVQVAGTKRDYKLAADSYITRSGQAYSTGDLEGGNAIIAEGVANRRLHPGQADFLLKQGYTLSKGVNTQTLQSKIDTDLTGPYPDLAKITERIHGFAYFDDEEKAGLIHQTTAKYEKRLMTDHVQDLIQSDPKEALATLDNKDKTIRFDSEEIQQLKEVATYARESLAQEEVRSAQQSLRLMPAEQLHKTTVEDLTRGFKQGGEWHRELAGQALAIKQGRAQINDPRLYEGYVAAIDQAGDTLQADPVWRDQYQQAIGIGFAGKELEALQSRLEKRAKGKSDVFAMSGVSRQLNEWRVMGGFGEVRQERLDARGQAMSLPAEERVQNAQVLRRQRLVREQLEREAELGLIKSPQEVKNRAADLVWESAQNLSKIDAGADAFVQTGWRATKNR